MGETRYHAIDKLRASMILTVAFGHSMLPYLTIPRRIKDPAAHIGFDVVGFLLYSFAMNLFFLTAGFSAALLLAKCGSRGLLLNRLRRIMLPFIAAWIVIAPLTRGAVKFARAIMDSGEFHPGIEALARLGWLDWSKIYHLWFLPALMIFVIAAIALREIVSHFAPQLRDRVNSLSRRLIASRWRSLGLVLLIAPPTILRYLYPHRSLGATVYSALTMFAFFMVGWVLYRNRDLLPRFRDQCGWLFGAGIVVLPVMVWASRLRMFSGPAVDPFIGVVAGAGNAIVAAIMTVALLELFQTRLNQPSATWRYVSDASYWIYLVHYPIVIATGGLVSLTPYPAIVKYALTLAIVVPILIASYEFAARPRSMSPAS